MAKAPTLVGFTFKKGDVIGKRFTVVKKLGQGGCGSVYLCADEKNGGHTAVKVLENLRDVDRFVQEAKVMKRTQHKHVVALVATGQQDRIPYIAMDYMEGGSVADLLGDRKKLPPEEAAWILVQCVRGLRAARSIHRDLKPENLLLCRGTKQRKREAQLEKSKVKAKDLKFIPGDTLDGAMVKVADFGLAKSHDREEFQKSLTRTDQIMGTPVYMSPEQINSTKTVTEKTDIYALGVMLYEMIYGRVPFDSASIREILVMQRDLEPDYGKASPPIKAILQKCLAKDPAKRFSSLRSMERALMDLAGMRGPEQEEGPGEWTRWMTWGVVIAVVLATIYVLRNLIMVWFGKNLGF